LVLVTLFTSVRREAPEQKLVRSSCVFCFLGVTLRRALGLANQTWKLFQGPAPTPTTTCGAIVTKTYLRCCSPTRNITAAAAFRYPFFGILLANTAQDCTLIVVPRNDAVAFAASLVVVVAGLHVALSLRSRCAEVVFGLRER
jgi:hypothetical protein